MRRSPNRPGDALTRDQHHAAATNAQQPLDELLTKTRLGIAENFNPLVIQIALECAKAHALAAIAASGQPIAGELLSTVVDAPPQAPAQPQPAPTNGSRLIVP